MHTYTVTPNSIRKQCDVWVLFTPAAQQHKPRTNKYVGAHRVVVKVTTERHANFMGSIDPTNLSSAPVWRTAFHVARGGAAVSTSLLPVVSASPEDRLPLLLHELKVGCSAHQFESHVVSTKFRRAA